MRSRFFPFRFSSLRESAGCDVARRACSPNSDVSVFLLRHFLGVRLCSSILDGMEGGLRSGVAVCIYDIPVFHLSELFSSSDDFTVQFTGHSGTAVASDPRGSFSRLLWCFR